MFPEANMNRWVRISQSRSSNILHSVTGAQLHILVRACHSLAKVGSLLQHIWYPIADTASVPYILANEPAETMNHRMSAFYSLLLLNPSSRVAIQLTTNWLPVIWQASRHIGTVPIIIGDSSKRDRDSFRLLTRTCHSWPATASNHVFVILSIEMLLHCSVLLLAFYAKSGSIILNCQPQRAGVLELSMR